MIRFLLAVGIALTLGVAQAEPPDDNALNRLKPGLSEKEVRELLGGPPNTIAREILYNRYVEQWTYDNKVRLEFAGRKGEAKQLQTWQRLSPN
jgi:hypothetical protein